MMRTSQEDNELREALRALMSDIEAMYEGPEFIATSGQPEEFFGPFSVWKQTDEKTEIDMSVSWPNLAISMRNAKNALRNADG
jgi:hypothetical protein